MEFSKIYLVDLENVGTKVVCRHAECHKDAKYVIFHSDNTSTPGAMLDSLPQELDVRFVDCRSGGNNAMDFCICALAGQLSREPGKLIRILSDDKGYDPVLHMLHQQGVRIIREGSTYQQDAGSDNTKAVQKEEIPKYRENVPIIRAIRACVPKKYQNDVIAVLPGAISRKEAHEMLQAVLPQRMVQDVYRKLKKHIPQEVVH